MKIKTFQIPLTLLFSLFIAACDNNTQNTEETSSQESTVENDETDEIAIEEYVREYPENLKALHDAFETESMLGEEYYEILGLTADDDPQQAMSPMKEMEVLDGYVFATLIPLIASDLYMHYTVHLAYYDWSGKLCDKQDYPVNDTKVDIYLIQDRFICIENTYAEYIEGEEGLAMEATGKDITDYGYYVNYPIRIPKLERVDPSEWPFLRNRIFAKHGYKFTTPKYQEYFADFDWYEPKHDNVDDLMTPREKRLADYIKSLEDNL
ncbi:YARHG domain-containing protein [Paracrocinitomix mangrovi]|uniref:YARHG domain-containing protein n=1 Tax=Paracrocinitomix mangrovi TaxID=2862509 RepID=UPI001C8EECCC|nr:YARHG domain-containing protein [Paracrocinitomix mangrovi]UKN00972.1 YARHG domain-containing protein [Paracrocinitomix mangrovi]